MNRLTAQVKEKLSVLRLKAVLFDMDGVIFDSMPHHAVAWVKAFADEGIDFNEYEAYKREGSRHDSGDVSCPEGQGGDC